MHTATIRKKAVMIRKIRLLHRRSGLIVFGLVVIISVSGLLLAWKKDLGGVFSTSTESGLSSDMCQWKSIAELSRIAQKTYLEVHSDSLPVSDYKVTVYPEKGTLKYVFEQKYFEVQIDAGTGEILHTGFRAADLIEQIHDGSIIDKLLKLKNGTGKLIYSSAVAVFSLFFSITGFWLWMERKKIKKISKPE